MAPTAVSRHDVFRSIATTGYLDWPAYDSTPLYDRSSLPALTEDFRTVSRIWFEHDTHDSVEYLWQHSETRRSLGFDSVPDQPTLWRSWNKRFSADLRETVERTARTILINAQNASVAVPRDPEPKLQYHNGESGATDPDDQTLLDEAAKISEHVSRVVFPSFSLDRGDGCEIHGNAYWGLQTYLGLRDGWLRTKALAVSSTNRLGTGRR